MNVGPETQLCISSFLVICCLFLDLAPGGLLSILKFLHWGLFEGRWIDEKDFNLHGALFETACFLMLQMFQDGQHTFI